MKLKFKELNSGYETEKKVKRFTRKQKRIAIIALVLVASFAAVYLASAFGIVSFDSAAAHIESFVTGSEKNFPIKISTEESVNMKAFGDSLIVLSDKEVTVYNANGNEVYSQAHTFVKPALSVNGENAVVFDRGGKGFMLLSSKKLIHLGEADGVIIAAEYGKSGNYALSTRTQGATSLLTVYDKSSSVVFQWKCAYEHITSIALSSDGKFAGVAVISAKNGDIYTTVHYFGFDYKEPLNSQTIGGTTALEVEFSAAGTLTLFGDNGIYKITKAGEKAETVKTFYAAEFNSYSYTESGKYVLSLAKYGSANVFELTLFSGKGKEKTKISINSEISSVTMSDKYIFALAESEIMVYNLSGRKIGTIDIIGELYSICPTDKYIFIHSLDNISRCFSYGDSSAEIGYSAY